MGVERFHPLVVSDLVSACDHYDAVSSALGSRFRRLVREKIQAVAERPESFGEIGGGFRGALVDRFPYVIVYTASDGTVSIFGIRHAASDRSTWFDRTFEHKNR